MSAVGDATPLLDVQGLIAPDARGEEARWFEHCRERRLMFHRCRRCSAALFPPRGACPVCSSTDLVWEQSAGVGTVYSYTVQHRKARADMPDVSVIALVDLDEGIRMMSRLVCPADEASVGMRVRAAFAAAGDATVPVFLAV